MAEVVAVIASTHHPFYYRASTATGEDRPPFADEWTRKILAFRETLTRAAPDVLVMVGFDHFHQLWLDNMPQFLVGKAPFYDANWYNEEREFGLPRMRLTGHADRSAPLLPVYPNLLAPPLPQPKRFVQLGAAIRSIVESWPSHLRVAIVGTGHLSLELRGPRAVRPRAPEPAGERRA